MKQTKKEIYAEYGIEYNPKTGKILTPCGWLKPLLKNGNSKLGKGVYTHSTLAGTGDYIAIINGKKIQIRGTCNRNCKGCYAQTGFYRMQSTVNSLAIRTIISREYPDFLRRACIAQIKADNIKLCRIHAAGDFIGQEYILAWREIVAACQDCVFWTYTKNYAAESAFNDLKNINIVKSCIPGAGFNFGPCEYIIDTYNKLVNDGKSVYICRCGFDADRPQHCNNCTGCSKYEHVLFLEHSTSYKGAADPLYSELTRIVNAQAAAI